MSSERYRILLVAILAGLVGGACGSAITRFLQRDLVVESIRVEDRQGRTRAVIGTWQDPEFQDDNSAGVEVYDDAGRRRAFFGSGELGNPTILLRDSKGKVFWSSPESATNPSEGSR